MQKSGAAVFAAVLGLVLTLAPLGRVRAQATTPTLTPPPGALPWGKPEIALAPAGAYAVDPTHAAVIARVSHIGYSFSVFRFDKVAGTLKWDPAAPARSSLTAEVLTASVATNVEGFATRIASPEFLNSAANPRATFVSAIWRRTDATHGRVQGVFTLMGRARPLTLDVALVGAGKGFGSPRLGVHATGQIAPGDFGLSPVFKDPIELVIDVEFVKTP